MTLMRGSHINVILFNSNQDKDKIRLQLNKGNKYISIQTQIYKHIDKHVNANSFSGTRPPMFARPCTPRQPKAPALAQTCGDAVL